MMSKRAYAASMVMAGALMFVSASAFADGLSPKQIYKTYGKAVVLVFATDGSAQGSAGTGSIISSDGQVITNAHVVAKSGQKFKKVFVYIKPDKIQGSMKKDLKHRYQATIIDIDPELDLALLRMVDPPPDLMTIQMANPDDVEIGDPVVAIGHPETGGLWTLTTGSISSIVADFQGVGGKDVYQTEASVNRGNSGGPLINQYGHMVGINTSISRRAQDGLAITDINFSLKSSVAKKWLERNRHMTVAYAPAAVDKSLFGGAVVAAAPPPKPTETKPAKPAGETYTVDGGDGKTLVAVVEPEQDEVVAEDPEFSSVASETQTVSRGMRGDQKIKVRGKSKSIAKPTVKPKQLTKARPYKLDKFVSERVKETRKLEAIMKDASRKIDAKRGRTGNKTKNKSKSMFDDL
ncbi:MAG: serine protease [Deltaproteobacteria bacterium]